MRYEGHKQEVRLLLPLGDQLISADSGGDVIVWDAQGGGEWREHGLQVHSPLPLFYLSVTHHTSLSVSHRHLPAAAVRPQHL